MPHDGEHGGGCFNDKKVLATSRCSCDLVATVEMRLLEKVDRLKCHIAFSYCLPHWKCLETATGFEHNTFKVQ